MNTIWTACALLAGAILIFFWLVNQEADDLSEEDRAYKDPLPPFMRLIWPLVRWADKRIAVFVPAGIRSQVERRLQAASLTHLIETGQFVAFKFITSVLAVLAYALTAWMLGRLDMVFLLASALLGFLMPDMWLNDIRKAYMRKVSRELPTTLDFLTLGLESGQNLSGAIRLTIAKAPGGVMRAEFARAMRDISAGVARAEALARMQGRMDIKEVTVMTAAMIQAEKVGASLGPVLREQAAQRRAERFLAAEKKAFEAPVKMIAPLVIFIFPCTFAFLGYFLWQKVAGSGAF
ncbi:MAG: type II secretion system F family protein [Candidatus Accumulibacter sp.]|jgi:tight adherence protein C|nr:type II secretion system F family protein [Accumulibacter sp.]